MYTKYNCLTIFLFFTIVTSSSTNIIYADNSKIDVLPSHNAFFNYFGGDKTFTHIENDDEFINKVGLSLTDHPTLHLYDDLNIGLKLGTHGMLSEFNLDQLDKPDLTDNVNIDSVELRLLVFEVPGETAEKSFVTASVCHNVDWDQIQNALEEKKFCSLYMKLQMNSNPN